jgi:hypothetical protein
LLKRGRVILRIRSAEEGGLCEVEAELEEEVIAPATALLAASEEVIALATASLAASTALINDGVVSAGWESEISGEDSKTIAVCISRTI